MKRCYLCMLSTLEEGQLAELSAVMVISPLQQPLVQWLSQRHTPPKTMWAFPANSMLLSLQHLLQTHKCLALHFPILISGKHSQQGLNQTKSHKNGGVRGFLKHHALKTRFSVLEAEKWLTAEGSLHPKHNNPCESSYFGNEFSDQTQKQQGNFHTNVIVKLQHRWYEIPQIPVEIFQYISLR